MKTRKLILIVPLLLTGCGSCQRTWTGVTGEFTSKCFKGVEYVQSDSGIAVAVDRDGKPLACGG